MNPVIKCNSIYDLSINSKSTIATIDKFELRTVILDGTQYYLIRDIIKDYVMTRYKISPKAKLTLINKYRDCFKLKCKVDNRLVYATTIEIIQEFIDIINIDIKAIKQYRYGNPFVIVTNEDYDNYTRVCKTPIDKDNLIWYCNYYYKQFPDIQDSKQKQIYKECKKLSKFVKSNKRNK